MKLVVLLHFCCFIKCIESQSKPNIILILADDIGYGDLSFYGHPTSKSPHLDQLAASSLVLRQFYAASPVCSPSRAALLTGKQPVSTGIWPGVLWPESIGGLDPESQTTLASRLLKIGYKTAHIGKWHLGTNKNFLPTNHGFEHYLGIPYSHDMCPCMTCFPGTNGSCFDTCRLDQVGCPLFKNEKIIEQPTNLLTLTEKYTQKARKFIQESNHDQQPFFLYMAYHQTHHPQFSSTFY